MKPKIAIPEPCSYDREYSGRALPAYLAALEKAGAEPVVIRLDDSPEQIARLITDCAGILLPGSKADVDPQKFNAEKDSMTAPPDPPRDAADELLLQDAYNLRKPILGICYGLQALNVWRSGTLVQHINSKVNHSTRREIEFAHQVRIEPGSLLARTLEWPAASGMPVNSSHHQAADVIGDGLKVSAICREDGIIEAIEGVDDSHYVLAVQWHPERSVGRDSTSLKLFLAYVGAVSRWIESRAKA
ncbi:MAG TPA: gamma-glutamyl-gamma-aminobutyrate hydrolase family protein [Candidatus Angelobacter sp.]|nr:gamma-glutamyl-gamma-aminobutyrate hydrolase family protein [Candidatus Angelobacter sp.]